MPRAHSLPVPVASWFCSTQDEEALLAAMAASKPPLPPGAPRSAIAEEDDLSSGSAHSSARAAASTSRSSSSPSSSDSSSSSLDTSLHMSGQGFAHNVRSPSPQRSPASGAPVALPRRRESSGDVNPRSDRQALDVGPRLPMPFGSPFSGFAPESLAAGSNGGGGGQLSSHSALGTPDDMSLPLVACAQSQPQPAGRAASPVAQAKQASGGSQHEWAQLSSASPGALACDPAQPLTTPASSSNSSNRRTRPGTQAAPSSSISNASGLFSQVTGHAGPSQSPHSPAAANQASSCGASPFAQPSSGASPFAPASSRASPFAQASSGASPFAQPTSGASPFAQPSSTASPFAQPSSGASPFAQASSGASPFAQASSSASPFAQASSSASPFAQPSSSASPFAQASSSASPFAQASSSASPFAQASSGASPFAQASSGASPFAQASSGASPFAQASSGASPFAQASSGASPFAQASSRASPFAQASSGATPVFCASVARVDRDAGNNDCVEAQGTPQPLVVAAAQCVEEVQSREAVAPARPGSSLRPIETQTFSLSERPSSTLHPGPQHAAEPTAGGAAAAIRRRPLASPFAAAAASLSFNRAASAGQGERGDAAGLEEESHIGAGAKAGAGLGLQRLSTEDPLRAPSSPFALASTASSSSARRVLSSHGSLPADLPSWGDSHAGGELPAALHAAPPPLCLLSHVSVGSPGERSSSSSSGAGAALVRDAAAQGWSTTQWVAAAMSRVMGAAAPAQAQGQAPSGSTGSPWGAFGSAFGHDLVEPGDTPTASPLSSPLGSAGVKATFALAGGRPWAAVLGATRSLDVHEKDQRDMQPCPGSCPAQGFLGPGAAQHGGGPCGAGSSGQR